MTAIYAQDGRHAAHPNSCTAGCDNGGASGAAVPWPSRAQGFTSKVGRTWPPAASDDACPVMTTTQAAGRTRARSRLCIPSQVADLLDTMAMADQALADELDRIGADRRRVCEATVVRLEQLLARVRKGADARAVLEGLDSTLLQDGALHWAARRHGGPSRPDAAEAAAAAAALPLSGGRRLSVVGGADTVAVTA